ncbi:hypothetical protein RHODOSMS8_02980 [Rhodobiaceae bacterium]|nr:hypothetical protein RHODOSMS8_02980 [Rhodobiaceae bacterium]
MSRLPNTENWDVKSVSTRTAFLVSCAMRASELSDQLGPAQHLAKRSSTIGATESFLEAAEINFVTDNFSEGFELLQQARSASSLFTFDIQDVLRSCVLMTLTDPVSISLTGDGIEIAQPQSPIFIKWAHLGSLVNISRALLTLILVAICSGGHINLSNSKPADRTGIETALYAAAASPGFSVLGFFGTPNETLGVSDTTVSISWSPLYALQIMEFNFENRVRHLAQDIYYWNTLRARAEIIDLRLLTVYIALFRSDRSHWFHEIPAAGEASQFLRELAERIHSRTQGAKR